MVYQDIEKNVYIQANEIILGDNLKFGNDIDIRVRGKFQIGANSVIGDRFKANAEEIIIGEYFFNVPTDSRGMFIGGGAAGFPNAKLKIGDRVVCHTGHINLACPVIIGDDVGLSHDVDIITHGFWASVLEGYPRMFAGVTIGNNVIVGWKTVIMSGVTITDNVVIGAQATVTKSLTTPKGIYVGAPAKLVKMVEEPSLEEKHKMFIEIEKEFRELVSYYKVDNFTFELDFPFIKVNNLTIDTEEINYTGEHDIISDAFRDFLRRYGIRLFAPQGFLFNLKRK
jgi:acetyltransferase-like isoleucine patch superfamily enzyme